MIEVSKFNNGFRVATDSMKDVETASVILAVNTGSRSETQTNNGISHFLEHMAFKGTKKRNAKEIAESVDNVGGAINAYTSKERTVYYIKVLKEDVELAVDILSDIIQNSVFDEEEVERERGVILQELSATLDTPDDVVFDHFYETLYSKQPLGKTILGPAENIKNFTRSSFTSYIENNYCPKNMVLSVAGNVSHKQVFDLAEKYFTNLNSKELPDIKQAAYVGGDCRIEKNELEQVQFLMGFRAFSYNDDNFYALQILSNILGGSMSSRLFQEIREKMGLVYTINNFSDCYTDVGSFNIYAGTSPDKLEDLVIAICKELNKAKHDINKSELQKTVNQFKAGLLMSRESTNSRAQKLAKDLLSFNRYVDMEEIMKKVKAVDIQQLQNVLSTITNIEKNKLTITAYGKVSNLPNYSKIEEMMAG